MTTAGHCHGRHRWLTAALVATALAPLPARADQAATGAAAVDAAKSRVYVRVGATGLGHEHGVVGQLRSGHIRLGASDEAGRLVFDMASFRADTDEARSYVGLAGQTDASTQQQVTANMLGGAVLDVARYPTAEIALRSAALAADQGPGVYLIDGQFTLHGQSRPLRFYARAETSEGLVRLRGRFAILQTQYGIRPYRKLLGAVGVADELQIWGDVWLAPPQ